MLVAGGGFTAPARLSERLDAGRCERRRQPTPPMRRATTLAVLLTAQASTTAIAQESVAGKAYGDTYATSQSVADYDRRDHGGSAVATYGAAADILSNQVTAAAVLRALVLDEVVSAGGVAIAGQQGALDALGVSEAVSEVVIRYGVIHERIPVDYTQPVDPQIIEEITQGGVPVNPNTGPIAGGNVAGVLAAVGDYAGGASVIAAPLLSGDVPSASATGEKVIRFTLYGSGGVLTAVFGSDPTCNRVGGCEGSSPDGIVGFDDLGDGPDYIVGGASAQYVSASDFTRLASDVASAYSGGGVASGTAYTFDHAGRFVLDLISPDFSGASDNNGDGEYGQGEVPGRRDDGHTSNGLVDTGVADSADVVYAVSAAPEGGSEPVVTATEGLIDNAVGPEGQEAVVEAIGAAENADPEALIGLAQDVVTGGVPEPANDFVNNVKVAITGSLNPVCSFSAETLDFGTSELGNLSGPVSSVSSLSVACTPGVAFVISNETGVLALDLDEDGDFSTEVSLYRDEDATEPFGVVADERIADTQSLEDHNNNDLAYTVYGRLHNAGRTQEGPVEIGSIAGAFTLRITY